MTDLRPEDMEVIDVGPNARATADGEHRCWCSVPSKYLSHVKVRGVADGVNYSVRSIRCMGCNGVVYCPAKNCFVIFEGDSA